MSHLPTCEQETYVVEGVRLLVREVRREDKPLFRADMAGLSRRSRFQRFFTATPALAAECRLSYEEGVVRIEFEIGDRRDTVLG
jgi:hypothetical protein